MIKQLLIIIFLALPHLGLAQVTVSRDELPNTNSTDSTSVLNNNLRLQQQAINSIGGYFNSNGYLRPANGGTGTNISSFPNGSVLIYDSGNVGIGTIAQGSSGQVLTSNGPGAFPSFTAGNPHSNQLFTTSGNFTVPAGINYIWATMEGGGGGGGSINPGGGGGGGGGAYVNRCLYLVTPTNTYSVTVGAGGTSGVSGGNSGFDSSTIIAQGGASNGASGGLGGATSTGYPKYTCYSIAGNNGSNGGSHTGGAGGSAGFGTGGTAVGNTNGNNATGTYGAGGSGAGNDNGTGGSGLPGFVLIEY